MITRSVSGEVPDVNVAGYDAARILVDWISVWAVRSQQKIRDAIAATKDFPA